MINRSVARRYSRALLDLVETDPVPVMDQLSGFQKILAENPSLSEVLSSPAFSLEERRKVLGQILSSLQVTAPLDRFLTLLVERRRLPYLPGIAECFQEMVDQKAGRVRVLVESATPLDTPTVAQLQKTIAGALSRQVILEQRTRPELIAGLTVRVGSLLVDGSLLTQLEKLREGLKTHRA